MAQPSYAEGYQKTKSETRSIVPDIATSINYTFVINKLSSGDVPGIVYLPAPAVKRILFLRDLKSNRDKENRKLNGLLYRDTEPSSAI